MENNEIQTAIEYLDYYLFEQKEKHNFTMLEANIEKVLNEYSKVKKDLKLKNEIIIKLAIKGIKDE